MINKIEIDTHLLVKWNQQIKLGWFRQEKVTLHYLVYHFTKVNNCVSKRHYVHFSLFEDRRNLKINIYKAGLSDKFGGPFFLNLLFC